MSGQAWSHPGYEAVAQLLRMRTGLEFAPNRFGTAEAGIRRAMGRAGVTEVAEYLLLLQGDRIADDDLISELTVGETYFFRDPAQFDFVRDTILPELRRAKGADHTLRAWSAGCASGEEPYSLAILFQSAGLAERAQVLGTDISRSALARARAGVYRQWSLRALEEARRERYFLPRDDQWELIEPIRRRVRFEHLNLAYPHYPSLCSGVWGMDLIFCRNVLIYLSPDAVHQVGSRLIASLSEHGWLLTGATDPPLGDVEGCQAVVAPGGVFYRRAGVGHPSPRPARATIVAVPPIPALSKRGASPGQVTASPPAWRAPGVPARAPVPVPPEDPFEPAQQALRSGDYCRAVELIDRLEPSAAACVLRVRALANRGRPELALQSTQEALRSHPFALELHFLDAALRMETGALEEAAQAVRRVLYLDRSLAVAHFTLGTILRRLGDLPRARRAYRNALTQSEALPQDAPLVLGEGECAGWLAEAANAQLALLEAEP